LPLVVPVMGALRGLERGHVLLTHGAPKPVRRIVRRHRAGNGAADLLGEARVLAGIARAGDVDVRYRGVGRGGGEAVAAGAEASRAAKELDDRPDCGAVDRPPGERSRSWSRPCWQC